MKRAATAFGAGLVVMAVSGPVRAVADGDQYKFFDETSPTIVDSFTHLEWDRNPDEPYPAAATFADAVQTCDAAGKRLPTLKELLTIVDEAPFNKYVGLANEARYIDFNAFNNTPTEAFWTSSLVKSSSSAYTVDFVRGRVDQASTTGDSRRVRCVKFVP